MNLKLNLWSSNKLEYFGTNWNILEHIGIFGKKLEYFGTNWNILEKIGIIWKKLEYFGKNWNILEQIGIFWNKLEYFGTNWNIWEKIGIFWSIIVLNMIKNEIFPDSSMHFCEKRPIFLCPFEPLTHLRCWLPSVLLFFLEPLVYGQINVSLCF